MPGFGNVLPSPGLMVSLVTPIPDNLHAHTCFVGGQQVRSVPPVDARTTMGCAQCSLRARLHQRTIAKLAAAKAYSLICLRPSAKQFRTKECGEVEARADKQLCKPLTFAREQSNRTARRLEVANAHNLSAQAVYWVAARPRRCTTQY
jgi:hypothetical protein